MRLNTVTVSEASRILKISRQTIHNRGWVYKHGELNGDCGEVDIMLCGQKRIQEIEQEMIRLKEIKRGIEKKLKEIVK
jgi:hypothetical protein